MLAVYFSNGQQALLNVSSIIRFFQKFQRHAFEPAVSEAGDHYGVGRRTDLGNY